MLDNKIFETRFVFTCDDFKNTKTLYQELGFEIFKEWDHGGKNGKGVVFKINSFLLEILEGPAYRDNQSYIYIETLNVDETWEKVKANSQIKILTEIKDHPWGHRNFMIQDPNGFRIKFFSVVGQN